jgi:hypothetical protein
MARKASRYVVKERKNGFEVLGRLETAIPGIPWWIDDPVMKYMRLARKPVNVTLHPHYWELSCGNENTRIDLCSFRAMVEWIATHMMSEWRPPAPDGESSASHHLIKITDWAVKRTAWALNPLIHAQWQRLLKNVDPVVLEVNKKVFATSFGYWRPHILFYEDIYENTYLVQDIVKFRAAAIAVTICSGYQWNPKLYEFLCNWRSIYAPEGVEVYTSLNKTLNDLPGGIPVRLLRFMDQLILPRPYSKRLELITTLCATKGPARFFRTFAFATEDKIKSAVKKVSMHLHGELSHRRSRQAEQALMFIQDYPDDHKGNISGLADKAIRWHRHGQEENARKVIAEFGNHKTCVKPPIKLPQQPEIRFLPTVGDIVEEGKQMGHCISSYAKKAAQGWCYLFHVDYAGESASVEVDSFGVVRQAYGPKNCSNAAATWGKRVLADWGRGISL